MVVGLALWSLFTQLRVRLEHNCRPCRDSDVGYAGSADKKIGVLEISFRPYSR
jgi:hypothetical protein